MPRRLQMAECSVRTELCDLAWKWGTDKALFYTPFYNEVLSERRKSVHKVLEIGIGYPELMLGYVERMGRTSYTTGASLFMWRDYFPDARIFGADINEDALVQSRRIQSFALDQRSPESFDSVIPRLGAKFEVIVEDGLHEPEAQLLAVEKLMPILTSGGFYFVEDVVEKHAGWLVDRIPYPCKLKEFGEARIIVVRHPKC